VLSGTVPDGELDFSVLGGVDLGVSLILGSSGREGGAAAFPSSSTSLPVMTSTPQSSALGQH
jgi:hypothetical protein